jgi:glucosamine--fructose-6-phosphate aminotransferase (isomerizing)
MCGIFCVVNDKTNHASHSVLEALKKLEYRGYDSWGIAMISQDKTLITEKHIGKIGQAKTYLPEGTIAIGHTRWATHGGVTDANAHPHLDCTKKIAVIHNGIVENHYELKEKICRNHQFRSETDTEIIAHLIEEEMKTDSFQNAVFTVFTMLSGSNAICVLDYSTQSIVTCRDGSPIVLGIAEDEHFFIASDVTPILKYTKNVYFVDDGEAVVLTKSTVDVYNIKTRERKDFKTQTIDWNVEDAEKDGHPHFLIKEILEQKKTLPKTSALNEKELISLAAKINSHFNLVLCGCGSAYYCALAAKYFFAKEHINTEVFGAYEFLPFSNICNKKTVFIAISQSGETADTLIATRQAKKKGAYIVALINARGSTLERLADCVLPVGAGPEIAVVSTKAFTSQLLTLYMLSQAVKGTYHKARLAASKSQKPLNTWFNTIQKDIVAIAKKLVDTHDIYIIGKYQNYPAALEFALKIKETSYIHSEAFSSGELKHGVITLIQKNTPCIVMTDKDTITAEVLSSATELKARGAMIIGISPQNYREFDYHIKTPLISNLSIIPHIIVGQLLGYYLGIGRGADPDKPRNLAKSVTVK